MNKIVISAIAAITTIAIIIALKGEDGSLLYTAIVAISGLGGYAIAERLSNKNKP